MAGFAYVKKRDGAPASYQVLLHEAKVVRDIFRAFAIEQKSISDIARELSVRDVPTRRGAARWGRPTVWTILRNPAYMGKAWLSEKARRPLLRGSCARVAARVRPRNARTLPRKAQLALRWITIDVPPIVSRELFEAAQAQLACNKRLAQRNACSERYLLQGLTVCAQCGYAFSGRSADGHAYYYCQGAHYRGEARVCRNRSIAGHQLDE